MKAKIEILHVPYYWTRANSAMMFLCRCSCIQEKRRTRINISSEEHAHIFATLIYMLQSRFHIMCLK